MPISRVLAHSRTEAIKILAVFDALAEAAASPTYNGRPFANANAEAAPDSVESKALRDFRAWLAGMFHDLAVEAGFSQPEDVACRLQVLYDGAISTSHLDRRPEAVELAKQLAAQVLAQSPHVAPTP